VRKERENNLEPENELRSDQNQPEHQMIGISVDQIDIESATF
jgi:hypothetical protein